jgi:hypothetical protein
MGGYMNTSKKKLWEVQTREFPNSRRLTLTEVFQWCDAAPSAEQKLNRYRQISMALQYPSHVFYCIEGTKYRGMRFGLEGWEYMSLYSGE